MINKEELDRIKRFIYKQHYQWYNEQGMLMSFVCETYLDDDDVWCEPYLKGKCIACHDIELLFEKSETDNGKD